MSAPVAPALAALFGSLQQLSQVTLQVVRDPYRLWLWIQLPLWLGLLVWGWQMSQQWLDKPVIEINVSGELKQLQSSSLEQQLWQHLSQGQPESVAAGRYMAADLSEFKQLLEQLPWVNEVSVRRQWPDGLLIQVREQHPVARWGRQGLVNEQGEVFSPLLLATKTGQQKFLQLPMLSGPENRSLNLMAQYRDFNQLLRPLGLSLTELQMEARGAWAMQLENGIKLVIGRGQPIEKMQRFSQVYSAVLKRYAERIAQVDVRYTNGLAVTWREAPIRRSDKK
ncbi:MAG: cell division protein FtsQ/DivIB [Motiliproteus sp.]